MVFKASRLVDGAKNLGNHIFEDGKEKLDDLQANLQESSDKVILLVHENPFPFVLVAAGLGFLLGYLMKK
ncbi:MAG: hypothetical protein H0U70_02270 [Tatlockia sp.]|nr:hypothetical protein [Tatlockia sp.]